MSNKMDKTLVVQVNRKVRHPVYEKFVSKKTKLYAHDDQGEAKVGDVVEIVQTRPLSKLKRAPAPGSSRRPAGQPLGRSPQPLNRTV